MKHSDFFWRRLHSLLGIIPIGAFLVQHLLINYFAVYGKESFNKAAGFVEGLPFLIVLEFVFIYLPILYHAILGIYIAFTARNNPSRYGYFRNWMFYLQRITGFIALVFIGWHVWQTRIQVALGNAQINYDMMADILGNPLYFWLYAIGVVSITFHFANGLWSFLVSWGITQSPKSQRAGTYLSILVFLAVTYIGIRALIQFAYGA